MKQKQIKPSAEEIEKIKDFINEEIPGNNPLYTIFIADARARFGYLRNWDKAQLVDEVLAHYKKIWYEAGINEKHPEHMKNINLLALATMTNGITVRDCQGALKYSQLGARQMQPL